MNKIAFIIHFILFIALNSISLANEIGIIEIFILTSLSFIESIILHLLLGFLCFTLDSSSDESLVSKEKMSIRAEVNEKNGPSI